MSDSVNHTDYPYFQVDNNVFDHGLNTFQLSVYFYLIRCANNAEGAYPSYTTIAKKAGMSRSKAMKIVDELIEIGLVNKQIRRKNELENYSNSYTVIVDTAKVEWCLSETTPSVCQTPPSVCQRPNKEPLIKNQSYKEPPLTNLQANPSVSKESIINSILKEDGTFDSDMEAYVIELAYEMMKGKPHRAVKQSYDDWDTLSLTCYGIDADSDDNERAERRELNIKELSDYIDHLADYMSRNIESRCTVDYLYTTKKRFNDE